MYQIFVENVQFKLLIILSVVLYIRELHGSHISTENDELIFYGNETLPSWLSYYKKTNGEPFNPQIDNHVEQNYWIETLVFADHTVMDRFENKKMAEDYVKTLMKMTDELFHHPSLGVNMSLVIQDIIWVSEAE
ncbi:unnamed protein product, partial [Trichobilharzia szidati]